MEPIPMTMPADLGGMTGLPTNGQEAAQARVLDGAEKAAIVLQVLARDGLAPPLHDLPEEDQARIIRKMGEMGEVDEATLEAVTDEFAALIEAGGVFSPAALSRALDLVDGTISPTVAQRLRAQAAERADPWERIAAKGAEPLAEALGSESIEVAAVILSKLPVSTAAEILGLLPGEQARRITYAVSLTSGVAPEAVKLIGHALARVLDVEPVTAFKDGPVSRVGAILNFSRNATRRDVLEGLDDEDAAFAEEVRKAIFTFANIPGRIAPSDIPKILRAVEQDVVVRALAGAVDELAEVAEFIYGALPKRMGDALREGADELGPVDEDTADAAMGQIIAVIREMEASGDIHLVAEDTQPG